MMLTHLPSDKMCVRPKDLWDYEEIDCRDVTNIRNFAFLMIKKVIFFGKEIIFKFTSAE